MPQNGAHPIRRSTKVAFGLALVAVLAVRVAGVTAALMRGSEEALLAFPPAAIFPALLILILAAMPPAASREGALMRVGTMMQCVAIVGVPALALHLALGLPVVFLAVELFETRCPASLREAIARLVVT